MKVLMSEDTLFSDAAEGCMSVNDSPTSGGSELIAVVPMNILKAEHLILDNQWITWRGLVGTCYHS